MARRLVTRIEGNGGRVAYVYRDKEWEEFVVEFYVHGDELAQSEYHTDERQDAIDTAYTFVRG